MKPNFFSGCHPGKNQGCQNLKFFLEFETNLDFSNEISGCRLNGRLSNYSLFRIFIFRGELEDRYLRLLEENVVLKKHAVKQEDKIKKLATKLIRVMSDKKRLEIGGGNASNIRGHHRDLETEELIEDQQQRIRELERVNTQFKDKLMVAKNQIMSVNQQSSNTRG